MLHGDCIHAVNMKIDFQSDKRISHRLVKMKDNPSLRYQQLLERMLAIILLVNYDRLLS